MKLSGNEDLYLWLVEQGPKDELPVNLVAHWRSLTRRNMESRLYALYRWIDGNNFTRQKFVYWLMDLVDWYRRFSGSKGGYTDDYLYRAREAFGGYAGLQQ